MTAAHGLELAHVELLEALPPSALCGALIAALLEVAVAPPRVEADDSLP